LSKVSEQDGALPFRDKVRLVSRIFRSFAAVTIGVRRTPLPALAKELSVAAPAVDSYPPLRLSRAVHKTLRIGPYRPRCLTRSLVLYRLLRQQGDPAELVLGLPAVARDHTAHAWVELDGGDVGPPPGKGEHVEIARYS
jgi:hypothetical protein